MMQYRESANNRRVQCLAAMYDSTAKRTRQKLVWTIDFYDPLKPRPSPDELAAGTEEQRKKWSKEITDYLDDREEQRRKNAAKRAIPVVEGLMRVILNDIKSPTPTLSTEEKDRINAMVSEWCTALNITPKKLTRNRKTEDNRAFGDELIAEANSLRSRGLSIADIAKTMSSDGKKVSKSWVQKWTRTP